MQWHCLHQRAHNATDGALCRFGDGAEVAATQPSGGGDSVLCVAPAAAAAGATPEWHEGFEAGLPDGSFTLGTARVDGGVLQLTSVEGGGAYYVVRWLCGAYAAERLLQRPAKAARGAPPLQAVHGREDGAQVLR